MRRRLEKEGKWQHRVPAQEEGEPPSKQPRTGEDDGDTDPEMPPLEDPPTEEGKYTYYVLQDDCFSSSRVYNTTMGRYYVS